MFIVYQICSYHHKTIHLQDQVCPLCQAKSQLQMHMMQKYMSWFGPMAPQNKYAVMECEACDKTIPNNKWNDALDALYKKHKAEIKTPLKLWQNMIAIPLILLLLYTYSLVGPKNPFGFKDDMQTIHETGELVKNIKVGDVLYVNFGASTAEEMNSAYGLVKIEKIAGEKVFITIYPERWRTFQDQYDIKKADIDSSKFASLEAPVGLGDITRNEQLMKLHGKAIERNVAKIEGFIK
jgi:hypothetical protein